MAKLKQTSYEIVQSDTQAEIPYYIVREKKTYEEVINDRLVSNNVFRMSCIPIADYPSFCELHNIDDKGVTQPKPVAPPVKPSKKVEKTEEPTVKVA